MNFARRVTRSTRRSVLAQLSNRRGPACCSLYSMPDKASFSYNEWMLLLTAFAAGTVDIISFATLGGVFASAMTGNFALLAYYVAQSDSQSAMGSVVALSGFAIGCAVGALQRRGRAQPQALNKLIARETGAMLFFSLYSRGTTITR